MVAKRRYWLVYRREIIEEYGETNAGPWQWQGKTMAVSAKQAVNNVRFRHRGRGGSLWFELPGDGMVREEWDARPADW